MQLQITHIKIIFCFSLFVLLPEQAGSAQDKDISQIQDKTSDSLKNICEFGLSAGQYISPSGKGFYSSLLIHMEWALRPFLVLGVSVPFDVFTFQGGTSAEVGDAEGIFRLRVFHHLPTNFMLMGGFNYALPSMPPITEGWNAGVFKPFIDAEISWKRLRFVGILEGLITLGTGGVPRLVGYHQLFEMIGGAGIIVAVHRMLHFELDTMITTILSEKDCGQIIQVLSPSLAYLFTDGGRLYLGTKIPISSLKRIEWEIATGIEIKM